jgi:hypothetical protein
MSAADEIIPRGECATEEEGKGPMTDDEARKMLAHHRAPLRGRLRLALDHAARAITDRAALVETVECHGYVNITALAARRHMRGEE